MNKQDKKEKCTVCGGNMVEGETTFTADFGSGVVVVRHVPAIVCDQCGSEWIDDKTVAKIELIVKDAKSKRSEIEVMSY